MQDYISISELIRMVQNELIISQSKRLKNNQPILFETSELEIELSTVVSENEEGTCILGIPVLKGEINQSGSSQFSQKIKLKLKATDIKETKEIDEEKFLPPNDDSRISGRFPQLEDLE